MGEFMSIVGLRIVRHQTHYYSSSLKSRTHDSKVDLRNQPKETWIHFCGYASLASHQSDIAQQDLVAKSWKRREHRQEPIRIPQALAVGCRNRAVTSLKHPVRQALPTSFIVIRSLLYTTNIHASTRHCWSHDHPPLSAVFVGRPPILSFCFLIPLHMEKPIGSWLNSSTPWMLQPSD